VLLWIDDYMPWIAIKLYKLSILICLKDNLFYVIHCVFQITTKWRNPHQIYSRLNPDHIWLNVALPSRNYCNDSSIVINCFQIKINNTIIACVQLDVSVYYFSYYNVTFHYNIIILWYYQFTKKKKCVYNIIVSV